MNRQQFLAGILAGTCLAGTAWAVDSATTDNRFDGYMTSNRIWPFTGQTVDIPVCWENYPMQFAAEKEIIKNVVKNTWEAHSLVRFTGWGACSYESKGIRIAIENNTIIPHVKYIGSTLDGLKEGMALNFKPATTNPSYFGNCLSIPGVGSDDKCSEIVGVHEFGHALGFSHEQNRPDWVEAVCMAKGYGKDDISIHGDTMIGQWDTDSVMNYCSTHWNNLGVLTKTDIASLKFYYDNIPIQRGAKLDLPYVRVENSTYEAVLQEDGAGEFKAGKRFDFKGFKTSTRITKTAGEFDGKILKLPLVTVVKSDGNVQAFHDVRMEYNATTAKFTVMP